MRVVSTNDFQLLEDGEVWTIDDLIHAIKPNGKTYKRRNYFCVVKSVIRDDTAWISYWNKASFSAADKTSEVAWLESAVLVKIGNNWQLQLLHSTKVDLSTILEDINFREYKG